MAKPINTLELHHPMIQFLIKHLILLENCGDMAEEPLPGLIHGTGICP